MKGDAVMNEFKTYHPIVNFIYYLFVIGFSMFLMHPSFLVISLICAIWYSFFLKGKKAMLNNIILVIPMMLCAAIINPAFNHEGVTIITYLPNGNPITAESVIYGGASATMLASVIFHFSCYNEIMTSDKFIYLFGKMIPVLSLIISMILRFVPMLMHRFNEIVNTQRAIGNDISSGSIIKRMKCGMKILSILVTWSLESALETADSMKSRGYGLKGRTAYSIYKFDTRDLITLLWILLCGIIVFICSISGNIYYRYFPSTVIEFTGFKAILAQISYSFLCVTPIIIEMREERRWKYLKSKI